MNNVVVDGDRDRLQQDLALVDFPHHSGSGDDHHGGDESVLRAYHGGYRTEQG